MINNIKRERILLLNYKIFLLLLTFTPFYLFENIYMKWIGNIAILTILLFSIFYIVFKMHTIKMNRMWVWFLIFVFYDLILFLRIPTIKALYSGILQISLLFFIVALSSISLDEKVMKSIFKYGRIMYLVLLIPASIVAFKGGREAFGMFNNYFSPIIYKLLLPCTFFFITNSKQKGFKILFFSLVYLRMVERTSAIVLIIIYLIYLMLGKLKKSKKVYKSLFIFGSCLILGFIYTYIQLQYTEMGYWLNSMFIKYTGGNFFSGRNKIWGVALTYFKKSPIWGYGLDNNLMSQAGINLSTHNTYIHLLLQGGIINVFIFFMFIYTIWEKFFDKLDDDIVRTAASYLIGILIFINFEVTLIGNSVVTAIFLWFVLGMGLIQCNNIDSLNKKEVI